MKDLNEITISMLVPVRPNSKFLAHFLFDYFTQTANHDKTELLLMMAKSDTWNKNLVEFFGDRIKVFYEDKRLGRWGHHLYVNELAEHAGGDWVLCFCDDMEIVTKGWDNYLRDFVYHEELNHHKVYQVIPGFVQPGAVEMMLSRGYLDVTGRVSGYPNTDSWVNTVMETVGKDFHRERCKNATKTIFNDLSRETEKFGQMFIHDIPYKIKPPLGPKWESEEVRQAVFKEAAKIKKAVEEDGR